MFEVQQISSNLVSTRFCLGFLQLDNAKMSIPKAQRTLLYVFAMKTQKWKLKHSAKNKNTRKVELTPNHH